MTEPTTPTGKRQHALAWTQTGVPVLGDHSNDPLDCSSCRLIKRIEQEAAAAALRDYRNHYDEAKAAEARQQERERLRALVDDIEREHPDFVWLKRDVRTLLADPEEATR